MSWFGEAGNHQAEMRHSYTARDQHGRKWLVVLEKKPMAPCYVTPMFDAPLIPPTHVLVFPEDMPAKVTIDYAKWIDELEIAAREYRQRRLQIERAYYGVKADPDGPASDEVLSVIGQPPMSTELVRKCQAGDKTLLGLKMVSPERPAPSLKGKKKQPAVAVAAPARTPMADVEFEQEDPPAEG